MDSSTHPQIEIGFDQSLIKGLFAQALVRLRSFYSVQPLQLLQPALFRHQ